MSILKEIKRLFGVKGASIEEALKNVDSIGGSGSSLPEVTADDNGDVLTVVDGAWAKAQPSAGGSGTGGTEVIEGTVNSETFAMTLTKTWSEIYALAESKKSIVIYVNMNEFDESMLGFTYFPVTGVMADTTDYFIQALGMVGQQVSQLIFSASSSDDYPVYGPGDEPTPEPTPEPDPGPQ